MSLSRLNSIPTPWIPSPIPRTPFLSPIPFDDEEAEAAAVVASAGDDKKARKNQGNGRGGGKKTKQQKPNVQDEEGLNLSGAVCFAYSCPDEVKQNSRFCRKHENLKVQTKNFENQ